MQIDKIAVLIQSTDGTAHQVLATKKQKEIALRFLRNEKTGALHVSEEIEAIEIQFKTSEKREPKAVRE